jgi:hypothetical protein
MAGMEDGGFGARIRSRAGRGEGEVRAYNLYLIQSDTQSKGCCVVPRGRGKVTIEVSRELRDRIRELSQKHGLLYEELLWKALDAFTQNSTRSEEGAGSRRGEAGAGGGHVWCREKGRVRDLQSLLKWVEERMGLLDWWEEEGMVCFRTRAKPAKA